MPLTITQVPQQESQLVKLLEKDQQLSQSLPKISEYLTPSEAVALSRASKVLNKLNKEIKFVTLSVIVEFNQNAESILSGNCPSYKLGQGDEDEKKFLNKLYEISENFKRCMNKINNHPDGFNKLKEAYFKVVENLIDGYDNDLDMTMAISIRNDKALIHSIRNDHTEIRISNGDGDGDQRITESYSPGKAITLLLNPFKDENHPGGVEPLIKKMINKGCNPTTTCRCSYSDHQFIITQQSPIHYANDSINLSKHELATKMRRWYDEYIKDEATNNDT